MPLVKVRENEPFENALRKFKKHCKRESHDKPSVKKKKMMIAAKKSLLKDLRCH